MGDVVELLFSHAIHWQFNSTDWQWARDGGASLSCLIDECDIRLKRYSCDGQIRTRIRDEFLHRVVDKLLDHPDHTVLVTAKHGRARHGIIPGRSRIGSAIGIFGQKGRSEILNYITAA